MSLMSGRTTPQHYQTTTGLAPITTLCIASTSLQPALLHGTFTTHGLSMGLSPHSESAVTHLPTLVHRRVDDVALFSVRPLIILIFDPFDLVASSLRDSREVRCVLVMSRRV